MVRMGDWKRRRRDEVSVDRRVVGVRKFGLESHVMPASCRWLDGISWMGTGRRACEMS